MNHEVLIKIMMREVSMKISMIKEMIPEDALTLDVILDDIMNHVKAFGHEMMSIEEKEC